MAKEKKMTEGEKLYLVALGAIRDLREKIKEASEKLEKAKKEATKKVSGKGSAKKEGGKCGCGCGEKVKPGSKFLRGHNFKK